MFTNYLNQYHEKSEIISPFLLINALDKYSFKQLTKDILRLLYQLISYKL